MQVMLTESDLTADSNWSTAQAQLADLAPFSAVTSEQEREQLFEDYVGDLKVYIQHGWSMLFSYIVCSFEGASC